MIDPNDENFRTWLRASMRESLAPAVFCTRLRDHMGVELSEERADRILEAAREELEAALAERVARIFFPGDSEVLLQVQELFDAVPGLSDRVSAAVAAGSDIAASILSPRVNAETRAAHVRQQRSRSRRTT